MKFALDKYAHLDSPIHRCDVRFKLIGFLALAFAFSFVDELYLLPAMVLVTAAMCLVSKLPASFILARWRYPSYFLIVVVVLLPFFSGDTVVLNIGPVNLYTEGFIAVILIATRFLSILTIGIILFGTAPFLTTIKAMRALGLPSILADMMLLTFRYLFEIGDYLERMRTSMALRGFSAKGFSLKSLVTLGWLGGSIIVRSYERSEWVYKAMILRGYGNSLSPRSEFKSSYNDILALALLLVIAAGFVTGDIILGYGSGT